MGLGCFCLEKKSELKGKPRNDVVCNFIHDPFVADKVDDRIRLYCTY